jgi:hypothetical protein
VIVAVAIVVALVCVLASARRLYIVAAPTALVPEDVIAAVAKGTPLEELRRAVDDEPHAAWERDLFDALREPSAEARAALVNEQLTELDLRMKEWERVPRVCASIATSFGILLGTLVLRQGLANAPDLSGELGEVFVRSVLSDAISVACFGIVGTAFCIGAHAHAKRVAKARMEAADRMVERLESMAAGAAAS